MKKMMVMLAVAACTAIASAATCKWNSGVVTLPDGTTQAGKDQVTGYVWEFASSTIYDKVAAGTLDVVAEFNKTSYGSLGAYSATKKSTATGKVALTGTLDVTSPNQVYAVILYTTGTGDDMKYIVNYAKSGDVGTTGVNVDELANFTGGKIGTEIQGAAISSWSSSAAPEPTSGLLLLLGMAGLALKRKRA